MTIKGGIQLKMFPVRISTLLLFSFFLLTFEAKAGVSQILTVFPTNNTPAYKSGTCTNTEVFTNSGSAWAVTIPEEEVFASRMKHNQDNSPSRSWELRIGKAGQIYSLRSSFGEAMNPQCRIPKWEYGMTNDVHPMIISNFAPWMESIYQCTMQRDFIDGEVPSGLNTNTDIHQSGIYLCTDDFSDTNSGWMIAWRLTNNMPFYSPYLAVCSEVDDTNHCRAFVTWAQQAHQPTYLQSQVMIYTKYRDVGGGILEVTYVVYNYGTNKYKSVGAPYGSLRLTTFPYHYYGDTNGVLIEEPGPAIPAVTNFLMRKTGGWSVSSQTHTNTGLSLGLVFGKDQHHGAGWMDGLSSVYSVTCVTSGNQNCETTWRNQRNTMVYMKTKVDSGNCFFYRYYFVFGTQTMVTNQIMAGNLVSNVDYGPLTFTDTYNTITWYTNKTTGALQTNNPNNEATFVKTCYAHPVSNNPPVKPVFYIKDVESNKYYIVTNAYKISQFPYDGRTEYLGLLGYEMP